jgi:hypothetical protein
VQAARRVAAHAVVVVPAAAVAVAQVAAVVAQAADVAARVRAVAAPAVALAVVVDPAVSRARRAATTGVVVVAARGDVVRLRIVSRAIWLRT